MIFYNNSQTLYIPFSLILISLNCKRVCWKLFFRHRFFRLFYLKLFHPTKTFFLNSQFILISAKTFLLNYIFQQLVKDKIYSTIFSILINLLFFQNIYKIPILLNLYFLSPFQPSFINRALIFINIIINFSHAWNLFRLKPSRKNQCTFLKFNHFFFVY